MLTGVRVEASDGGVLVWLKVVPGAKRDGLAGALGERLKVRVSAPPEDGRANAAVCAVLAAALGVKARAVTIAHGACNPEKVARVEGLTPEGVRAALSRSA